MVYFYVKNNRRPFRQQYKFNILKFELYNSKFLHIKVHHENIDYLN